ncbi:MAG: TetR/AcrR family transcriptional regulator [Aestuariivirgaceae bacterium]
MARRAIDNREELDAAMIEAAQAMIRKDGAASLTARSIARQLGVSVGTVYNVHGSMDGLIEAVNARTLARLEREIAAIDVGQGSVEDVLVAFAERYMTYVQNNLNLWSVLFEGQLSDAANVNQVRIDRLFGFLEKALEPVAHDAEIRARSARVLWASVHGILQMAFTCRLQLLKIDDVKAVVRHAIACHLAGLAAKS